MLDRLFDADRATLITEVVLRSIREFDVEASQLHNDSTATPVITYSTEVATAHRYRGVRRHDRPTDGAEEPQFPWQRR